MSRFKQRYDGEGWTEHSHQPFKIACCECGLVHRIVVTTATEGQPIGIAAEQDRRSTGQRRRRLREQTATTTAAAAGPELPFPQAPPSSKAPHLYTPPLL